MSLSTNSWDIVYTSKLDSINTVLPQDYKPKVAIITANRYKLTITNIKGEIDISTSSEKTLKFTLTFEGSYELISNPISNSLTNAAITYSFDIDPLQTLGIDFNTSSGGGAFTTPELLSDFLNYCKNSNFIQEYFSSLTIFKDLKWIDMAICKVAIKENKYLTGKDKYISFCYMLSRKEKDTNGNEVEKAINYNDPYVDLNAIPEGAFSALIIERSLFGMYMVAPKIGKDILQKFDKSDGDVSFDKLGAYTMINKEKSKFRYADFITSLTYIGIVPIVDWLSSLFGGVGYPIYRGTVPAESASITVNEDHINFRVKDAEYMHSLENWPKITQDYIVTLKYEKTLKASARLIDAGINYFHTDFIPELWYIFIGSIFKKLERDSDDGNRTYRVYDYLPFMQIFLRKQLKLLSDVNAKDVSKIKQKMQEIQNESELGILKRAEEEGEKLKRKMEVMGNNRAISSRDVNVVAQNKGLKYRNRHKRNQILPYSKESKEVVAQVQKDLKNNNKDDDNYEQEFEIQYL